MNFIVLNDISEPKQYIFIEILWLSINHAAFFAL